MSAKDLTMPGVELSCIAYRLGRRAEVAGLSLEREDRERLLGPEGGLRYHRVSTDSCLDLAIASARETLELGRRRRPRLRVDLVVVASNSLGGERPLTWTAQLTAALQLPSAAVQFVSGGDCCNFQVASRICHALVSASPEKMTVLFVTVDRVADVCPGRYLAVHGAGINSDAAASCLFAGELTDGFRLGGFFAHAQDCSLLEESSGVSAFPRIMTLVKSVFRQIYGTHHLAAPELGQVLTNTHTNAVAEIVGLASRVPLDKVFRDNIPVTGHCFAADNLINLHSYASVPSVSDSPIVLIGSGVHQWGGFVVQRNCS